MCERVTMLLNDLRERYSLEVSSPGSERPLTKPAHFRRFVGRRARVRTRHPRPLAPLGDGERAGGGSARAVQSFTGELVGASEDEVTLAADGGVIAIPYSEIRRSNLIGE
jgi:ribosome maturation factor RimP